MKAIQTIVLSAQAAVVVGMMTGSDAQAQALVGSGRNDFGSIVRNVNESIAELPNLLAALAYLIGLMLGVLGIMKIKDHVENPTQTALKDGVIRLAAGGALFALPMIFEAMQNTVGTTPEEIKPAKLNPARPEQ